jgi:ubiquinone biosynthesis protein
MNARHQRRRQIVDVLVRHGMGFLVSDVGLEHLRSVESGLRGRERRDEPHTRAERLRLALEELGPTFVKVGQLLSTRADLLAPEYRAELAKLQDAVPGVSAEAVREAISLELGGDADVVFARFDPSRWPPLRSGRRTRRACATAPTSS